MASGEVVRSPLGDPPRDWAEQSADLVARFDRDGRYRYANPSFARAARAAVTDLLGTHVGDAYMARTGRPLPPPLQAMRRAIASVLSDGQSVELDTTIRWDDEERTYRARYLPETDGTGMVTGVLYHGQDTTEQRRAEHLRRRLLERLQIARDEERRALARELHDGIGQSVTAIAFGMESILRAPDLGTAQGHAAHLREVAAETLDTLRRLAHGLHPRALEDLGLEAAVERRATDFIASFGIPVDVVVSGVRLPRLSRETEAELYAVFTEALTNVARHSRATRASVMLHRDQASVDLVIEDDGIGFAVQDVLDDPAQDSFGLRGIVERARARGGMARIESVPGGGTTVAVRFHRGGTT